MALVKTKQKEMAVICDFLSLCLLRGEIEQFFYKVLIQAKVKEQRGMVCDKRW
ncbi:hypothetical protein [Bartonella sp. B17]